MTIDDDLFDQSTVALLALSSLCFLITLISFFKMTQHIAQVEGIMDACVIVEFFVPLIIIYGMSAWLLAIRHRMAYVFWGMGALRLVYHAKIILMLGMSDEALLPCAIHATICFLIVAGSIRFLISREIRRQFGWTSAECA